jgi:hypothetical protein
MAFAFITCDAGASTAAELAAAPCMCGHSRDVHREESPHDCLVEHPGRNRSWPCDCRSFTPATPLAPERAP